jgi:eukaryotic-like serine/threonine-protein kinase
MSDPKRCERCGRALPRAGGLGGSCPRCMVEMGLESTSALRHAFIGTDLLHYRIESHLGTGGMGEVYQARDMRLERRVAIKILPEVFAQDSERTARFQREAMVLASLNHPNIAALYGLEQQDGPHFLVMELVEGDTLADRIGRGPVPVEEALTIAHQITQALEAAHEKGVVHRDLKPANVKITPEGRVKVLDFGLAKAMEALPAPTPGVSAPLSMAPANASEIMGTPAYMAPEQAMGFAADPRSDIFAFGCVLYETLNGCHPFRSDPLIDVVTWVLTREPDLALLPPNLHPRIPELIRRCLAKETKNRWHSVADVRLEIESILPDPHGTTARLVKTERGHWRRRARQLVVTASLAVAITAGITWNLRPAPPSSVARFSIVLPNGQQLTGLRSHNIALSPDGESIVYVANNQLYLRTIAEVEARPIPGTAQRDVDTPFFSPDGRWIGFYVVPESKLKKIAITGGASVTVADASYPFGASWGPDDWIVIGQGAKGIVRVSASAGRPETIVNVEKGEVAHGPQILPDGEHILFTLTKAVGSTRWDQAQIVVQSLKSGERKVLIEGGSDARYVSTGHIVYALGSDLLAIPFDEKRLKCSGGPVRILEKVMRSEQWNTAAAFFNFSNNGSMVYFLRDSPQVPVTILAFTDGVGVKEVLPFPAGHYANPRISPDGKQLVAEVEGGNGKNEVNLWIYDLSSAMSPRRLTLDGGTFPIWTRDSRRIVYTSNRDGGRAIYWQRADGSGSPERLTEPKQETVAASSISEDGTLVFTDNSGDHDIWMLSMVGDRKPQPLIKGKGSTEWRGSFSPDGRWIAYASDESKQEEIYVQPFPPTGAKYQITTNGGTSPLWSPDGKKLFYLEAQDPKAGGLRYRATEKLKAELYRLISVHVRSQAGFAFSDPTPLIEGMLMIGPRPYDIAPDGKQFVAVFPASETISGERSHPEIRVTLNWLEELKQRVPVK